MQRMLYVGVLLTFLVGSNDLWAVQRVVLAEEFTGTWCPYCPGAARGLHDLAQVAGDTVAIIAYHIGDAFTVLEANIRDSYYNIPGYPTVRFDGIYAVVGGSYNGSMFPQYYSYYNFLKTLDQPIDFTLDGTYEYNLREGMIHIQLENTDTVPIAGNLRTAIVLIDTPYVWQNMTELEWVLRDMIPDAFGVPISLDAGAIWDTTLSFTIPTNVSDNKIQFVVFVQRDDTKQVYGASKVDLLEFSWVSVSERDRPEPPSPPLKIVRTGPRTFEIQVAHADHVPVRVRIWNTTGQRVFQTYLVGAGRARVHLPVGVYVYQAETAQRVLTDGKLVVFP